MSQTDHGPAGRRWAAAPAARVHFEEARTQGRSFGAMRTMRIRIISAASLVLALALTGSSAWVDDEGVRARRLIHGAPSAEALIDRLLQALRNQDRDALRRLRLSEGEYREIVLPGHVTIGAPLRRYPEDVSKYAWGALDTKSAYYELTLLAEFGGRAYEVENVAFEKGTETYATYTARKQLRVALRGDDGDVVELATGSIAEIDGSFKFVSFIRD
jgi:hypothetical protein